VRTCTRNTDFIVPLGYCQLTSVAFWSEKDRPQQGAHACTRGANPLGALSSAYCIGWLSVFAAHSPQLPKLDRTNFLEIAKRELRIAFAEAEQVEITGGAMWIIEPMA
jgi:hypothetical protein